LVLEPFPASEGKSHQRKEQQPFVLHGPNKWSLALYSIIDQNDEQPEQYAVQNARQHNKAYKGKVFFQYPQQQFHRFIF
jgi:hypothetical protein